MYFYFLRIEENTAVRNLKRSKTAGMQAAKSATTSASNNVACQSCNNYTKHSSYNYTHPSSNNTSNSIPAEAAMAMAITAMMPAIAPTCHQKPQHDASQSSRSDGQSSNTTKAANLTAKAESVMANTDFN